jgi:hypothetical protein
VGQCVEGREEPEPSDREQEERRDAHVPTQARDVARDVQDTGLRQWAVCAEQKTEGRPREQGGEKEEGVRKSKEKSLEGETGATSCQDVHKLGERCSRTEQQHEKHDRILRGRRRGGVRTARSFSSQGSLHSGLGAYANTCSGPVPDLDDSHVQFFVQANGNGKGRNGAYKWKLSIDNVDEEFGYIEDTLWELETRIDHDGNKTFKKDFLDKMKELVTTFRSKLMKLNSRMEAIEQDLIEDEASDGDPSWADYLPPINQDPPGMKPFPASDQAKRELPFKEHIRHAFADVKVKVFSRTDKPKWATPKRPKKTKKRMTKKKKKRKPVVSSDHDESEEEDEEEEEEEDDEEEEEEEESSSNDGDGMMSPPTKKNKKRKKRNLEEDAYAAMETATSEDLLNMLTKKLMGEAKAAGTNWDPTSVAGRLGHISGLLASDQNVLEWTGAVDDMNAEPVVADVATIFSHVMSKIPGGLDEMGAAIEEQKEQVKAKARLRMAGRRTPRRSSPPVSQAGAYCQAQKRSRSKERGQAKKTKKTNKKKKKKVRCRMLVSLLRSRVYVIVG